LQPLGGMGDDKDKDTTRKQSERKGKPEEQREARQRDTLTGDTDDPQICRGMD
jgi:hypothetical protein